MKNIQEFCKDFRTNYLKITLQEVQDNYDIPFKALSAFENGRSSNINHLNTYYLLCKTQKDLNEFIKGIGDAIILDKQDGMK